MTTISSGESALLGLLSEEPMHPYQIEQQVKYRDMRFWTELSMSSIYKLLRKLEKRSLVLRKNIVSSENRLRKVYSITNKGKKVLKENLERLLSEPEHIRWQIDISSYNCDLLPLDTVQEKLKMYRKALEEKIKGYQDLLKFLQKEGCPVHRFGIASRPIFLLKGEIKWVDLYLNQISKTRTK